MVDNADYLQRQWFEGKSKVGVTAGASAPEVLVKEVIAAIDDWAFTPCAKARARKRALCLCCPALRKE